MFQKSESEHMFDGQTIRKRFNRINKKFFKLGNPPSSLLHVSSSNKVIFPCIIRTHWKPFKLKNMSKSTCPWFKTDIWSRLQKRVSSKWENSNWNLILDNSTKEVVGRGGYMELWFNRPPSQHSARLPGNTYHAKWSDTQPSAQSYKLSFYVLCTLHHSQYW